MLYYTAPFEIFQAIWLQKQVMIEHCEVLSCIDISTSTCEYIYW